MPSVSIDRPSWRYMRIDRNGDGDRRHHAGREDEKQEIVLQRHLEARKAVGRQRFPRKTARKVEPKPMMTELMKRLALNRDGPVITMLRLRTSSSYQVSGRRQRRRYTPASGASPCGEQVHVALERSARRPPWADRRSNPAAILKPVRKIHTSGHQGDQRVDHHQRPPRSARRRPPSARTTEWALLRAPSSLLHPVERLDVDVAERRRR